MPRPSTAVAATETDPRWAVVCARTADATFFYSVETTGVFCRPDCGARLPRPEHVRFFDSMALAERAGFRACKRCRPGAPPLAERNAELVAGMCRLIEKSETAPSLEDLARHADLSPFYVQRMFKAVTGITPKAYAAAKRSERMREALTTTPTVTQALYEAGYGSPGRLYADPRLGMTPGAYKAGGKDLDVRVSLGTCSLGKILVAATDKGVCAILLGDDHEALRADLARRFPRARIRLADTSVETHVQAVIDLVEHPHAPRDLPLDIRGTAFQQRVWKALAEIPAGSTTTYAAIARSIGAPKAVRAVGTACGANALAVAIPCHRVVGATGALSGYRWGLERKRALLARESERDG